MVYPADEETFDERTSPEWVRQGHLNSVQEFLKRIQDFLGYGGRLHDKTGLVIPPGAMIEWPDVAPPSGWLLCDGQEYLRAGADYVDLFAVIGTKYGSRDEFHFNVPDRRGLFTRGYSKIPSIDFTTTDVDIGEDMLRFTGQEFYRAGIPVRFTTAGTLPAPLVINTTYYIIFLPEVWFRICTSRANALAGIYLDITSVGAGVSTVHPYIEEDKDSRLALTVGGNAGEDLGSYQEDEHKKHRHFTVIDGEATSSISPGMPTAEYWASGADNAYNLKTTSGEANYDPSSYSGGVESRPRNVNVNYIIKM